MLRLLIVTALFCPLRNCSSVTAMSLRSVDFEVFGRVQGVFFRKYTQKEAEKLGLKGWCRNTSKGTVQGQMQGPCDGIETMKQWLRNTGSPSSQIDKAEFKNEKEITEYSFENFSVRRDS